MPATIPVDALLQTYHAQHHGSPAGLLLGDIVQPMDADLMAIFYELPRKGLSGVSLENEQRALLQKGFATNRVWAERLLLELE